MPCLRTVALNHLKLILLCLLLCASLGPGARAANKPPEEQVRLEDLKTSLAQEQEKQAALSKNADSLKNELEKTRRTMTALAADVQKNEKSLQALENKIADLSARKAEIDKRMEKDRAATGRLILALTRMKRQPPEAMIARPDKAVQTARSALIMKGIIAAIDSKTASLRADLDQLSELVENLEREKHEALKQSESLIARQEEMDALLKKREGLYASTMEDVKTANKTIQKISAEAKNLQDLLRKLDEARARAQAQAEADQRTRKRKDETEAPQTKIANLSAAPPPRPGSARLPVPGAVTVAYDEPDSFGAPSKGITIEARAGALVVAPMGGTVRFAGPFKNYGNMVIIEHRDDYHSLIAGLEKIDTVVERQVGAGEPLGKLKTPDDG
ncbi:MAG: peptidoglycan DD-metalloendopeptidase family protein, partial [Alphaproteobacteria bacterium]|nr:peptidoglycan DD-metalloendopeptidase family protein [Alphaproteobacteria bacterium]